MADMGPDKTDSDWRARPSADADDGPPRRDDAFGDSESNMLLLELYHDSIRFPLKTKIYLNKQTEKQNALRLFFSPFQFHKLKHESLI